MDKNIVIKKLSEKSLRITPQRTVILQAIMTLNNHPTAENIIEYVRKRHPNISVGAVYKVLDSFVENNIIEKVKTEKGVMRFDATLKKHHHLYCEKTDRIEDYEDETLDELIKTYFKKNHIKNFEVKDFKLEITGIINKN